MRFALDFARRPPLPVPPHVLYRPFYLRRFTTDMEDGSSTGERTNFTPVKLPPSSSSSTSSGAVPRPHRCEICQRSFREMATLRKHEQLHRADRPYVCQTCGKSFLWSSNLKVHERVHTGERPYKCKICHRCFTQSNDLRRHERNVHMRGKLYGYKHGAVGVGRGGAIIGGGAAVGGAAAAGGGSHVNLAAYQAFAMQQRALLQQALTYESYLHTAAVTQAQMFPQPSQSAPLGMPPGKPDGMPSLCMPGGGAGPPGGGGGGGVSMAGGGIGGGGGGMGVSGGGGGIMVPRGGGVGGVGVGEDPSRGGVPPRDPQRSPIKLEQVTPPNTPGDGEAPPPPGMGGDKRGGASSVGPHGGGHDNNNGLQHSPVSPRFLPSSTCHVPPGMPPLSSPLRSPNAMMLPVGGGVGGPMGAGGGVYPAKDLSPLHRSPLNHQMQQQPQQQMSPPSSRSASSLPSFSSFRHPPHSSTEYEAERGHAHTPLGMGRDRDREAELRERDAAESNKYPPCDSVMDLSMSKTPDLRPGSAQDGANNNKGMIGGCGPGGGDVDGRGGAGGEEQQLQSMPPPKTPSSESECEGKRDVTTTSSTPVADNGIHHCQHCNIFFYDYTMFHLHDSLHSPYHDYPFRCPSCGKHCQDRIEFMFHTVWHVKYPHTIPNYQPFKDNFIS